MIIDKLKNKKIVILGYGREGKSTLNYIRKYLKEEIIAIADDNIDNIEINDKNIIKLSKNYLKELEDYDLIIKAPGIPVKDHKYDNVLNKITSQIDLFMDEYKDKIIGITGTKGKSTTSTLIYHLLKNCGKNTILAGNIGIPVFDIIDQITNDTIIVLELSCHQLEFVHSSPHIGILLNIYQEHLDHYDSFEAYQNCKKNIYNYMKKNDILIYNPDNEYINLSNNIFKSIPITNNLSLNCKNTVKNKVINYEKNIIDLNDINIKLLGDHNYLNIGFAYIVSKLFNINDNDFINALLTFEPLPHRMEYIGEKNGNKYYNDSISTIPEATIKAVESIPNIKTVIIGGMDRGIDYKKLVEFIPKSSLENIIFLPDSGIRIKKDLEKYTNKNMILVPDLETAVNISNEITNNGGILLSPAAASYGVYKNFEERGNHFKECFNNIKES